MPDIIRFSDMKNDHPLQLNGANDLLAIAVVSGGTETGYNSMTTTPNQLGQHTVIDQEFANFTTTAKTVQGAINELKESGGVAWTDITGTLTAGQTSLTLQNAAITESSTIDYYTNVFGVSPTDAVVTNGQIVLTFEAQSSDLGVKVRVS